jgi:hypothetical protein
LVAESLPNAPDLAFDTDDEAEQKPVKNNDAASTASIIGTVQDPNHLIVPGASVRLENLDSHKEKTLRSGENGDFTFARLAAGRYKITITSAGMGSFTQEFELKNGESHIISDIVLPIATQQSEVRVYANKDEIAQEEVTIALQQRVLGVFPNFYSAYDWNAPALPAKQKYNLVAHSIFDPVSFLVIGMQAGAEQAQNTYPSYGQGMEGYGKRYGAAFTTEAVSHMMGRAVYPALFHQDPRYFYKGTGSVKSRAFYAIAEGFMCRGDNGKQQFNYSRLLGSLTAGAVSNLYYPANDRGVSLTFTNAALSIAGNAAGNLVREFVLKGFTSHSKDKAPALQ